MTQTLYFTCLVTCVSIQLFQIQFFFKCVHPVHHFHLDSHILYSTLLSSTLINSQVFLSLFLFSHWRTFYRAWYSLTPNPTSASICLCPILLLLDGSCSEIPKGDKSSLWELEWHQYDRADVCFGITDIRAETMLVSDNCSHQLLLPVSFSSCLLGSMRQFDRAALFIEACLKYGVMEANDTSNILFESPLQLSKGHL